MNPIHILILILAVGNIAIADVCIMKAAESRTLLAALVSPWMLAALTLYFSQIVALTYFFVMGWEFGATSMLQLVIYALVVVAAAIIIFGESMTPTRILGVGLALIGVAIIHAH